MLNNQILEDVKKANTIGSGKYLDGTVVVWIDEVERYLIDAGVSKERIINGEANGLISLGVNDIWNSGAGDGRLSDYFNKRMIQMATKK